MKKHLCWMALAGVMTMHAASVLAADGKINFTGKITDQACEIDDDDKVLDVDMGVYSVKQFNATVGVKTPPIPVNIKLSGC